MLNPFRKCRYRTVVICLITLLVCVAVAAVLLIEVFGVGSIALPPLQPVEEVVHLNQGWEDGWQVGQKQWFHHASQGTTFSGLRYEWFMALEQPELSIFATPGLFSDSEYLQRFGFLPSEKNDDMNPDGLPVGFAKEDHFQEPYDDAPDPYKVVGFTCAACHTTQLNYEGTGIRIDGGSAMVDLGKFQSALGRAVFYTDLFSWRFKRFANRVLGDDHEAADAEELRTSLKAFVTAGKAAKAYADEKHLYDLEAGFGRTDALGLILNRVFDDLNEDNLAVADAPVNIPHIWDSSWFEFVQYNASIRTPMTRNIGEALGVGALINTTGVGNEKWRSTVNVENLWKMEEQLSGDKPFSGLQSPEWPKDVLGELDDDLKAKGGVLYARHCQRCHWKIDDIKVAYETKSGQFGPKKTQMWTPMNKYKKRFINTSQSAYNVEQIGTDPGQALNFARRVVILDNHTISRAGDKLEHVTSGVRKLAFRDLGWLNDDEEVRDPRFDGYRVPWEDQQRAFREDKNSIPGQAIADDFESFKDAVVRLEYKARPLNGVWATAPYLHNGSVRTLYQLLSPVAEREKKFHLGSREFDPKHVGFKNEKLTGGFELDTTLKGNYNTGHEFRDLRPDEKKKKLVKGVLGPAFSVEERLALIEYLKSL